MKAANQQATVDRRAATPGAKSFGLEWLWQYLQDVPQPHVLDGGHVRQATVDILLRRGVKLYVGEMMAPLQQGDASLWDHSRKTPEFRADRYLAQWPRIPPGTLSAIFCWQLFDLLPRDALPEIMLKLYLCLEPKGVIFCLLREPYLQKGSESRWWLESLTTLGRDGEGTKPFPHPAVTNREMERLIPTGSIKTFLTRSGWREALVIR